MYGRDAGGEIHVAQFQPVPGMAAEAHHQVDIVAHVFAIFYVGERHIRGGGHDPDRAVFPGQIGHVHHLSLLIHAEPDIVQFLHGAILMAEREESVQLRAQGGTLFVIFAESEAVFLIRDPLMDIVDFRLLRVDGFQARLVAQIGVDYNVPVKLDQR